MDPFPLQWRLYNHNILNSNLWFIKYNVYAGIDTLQKRPQIRVTYIMIVDSCRGATVGDRGSMAWMPAYIAVSNLRSMISVVQIHCKETKDVEGVIHKIR
jgi:hypothetical protein